MPYTIEWYIPQRVLRGAVWGTQTLEELTESNQKMMSLLDEGTPLVHFILDDSRLERTPVNLKQLQNTLAFGRHRSLGWILLVGGPIQC